MKYKKLLTDWLKQRDWDDEVIYNEEADESILHFNININDQIFRTFIEGNEKKDWLSIFMYAPITIKKNKESEVLKLFNHINSGTFYGRLILLESGIVQYKQTMPLDNVDPSIDILENIYSTSILLFEHWLDDIAEVGLTKTTFEQWKNNLESE